MFFWKIVEVGGEGRCFVTQVSKSHSGGGCSGEREGSRKGRWVRP